MAVFGTEEGRSEAGGCLGRAEHRGWGTPGSCGRGSWSPPSVSWLVPVLMLPASPGAAQLGPNCPTEVQIWCEGRGGCHAHMGTHRDVRTGSQRHRPRCVNSDTDTPWTLHRYTPTHKHDHPCTPSGCHHTHTHKDRCP